MSNPQPFIVVSGQPRSGTSLMMRILHDSDIGVIADEMVSFEYERLNYIMTDKDWIHNVPPGWAIKILFPLVVHLPLNTKPKIIWMYRNSTEQAKSQRKFGAVGHTYDGRSNKINRIEKKIPKLFGKLDVKVLRVSFDKLVRTGKVGAISDFLGTTLDPSGIVKRNPKCSKSLAIGALETKRAIIL